MKKEILDLITDCKDVLDELLETEVKKRVEIAKLINRCNGKLNFLSNLIRGGCNTENKVERLLTNCNDFSKICRILFETLYNRNEPREVREPMYDLDNYRIYICRGINELCSLKDGK